MRKRKKIEPVKRGNPFGMVDPFGMFTEKRKPQPLPSMRDFFDTASEHTRRHYEHLAELVMSDLRAGKKIEDCKIQHEDHAHALTYLRTLDMSQVNGLGESRTVRMLAYFYWLRRKTDHVNPEWDVSLYGVNPVRSYVIGEKPRLPREPSDPAGFSVKDGLFTEKDFE